MRRLGVVLLAWAATVVPAAAEEPLTIVLADPLVRPGILWRCTVRGSGELPPVAVRPGPAAGQAGDQLALTVSLVAGTTVLAAREVPLDDPLALRSGIRVVLAPLGPFPVPPPGQAAEPLEVRARLARVLPGGNRPVVARTARALDGLDDLVRRAEAAAARLASRPLPAVDAALPALLQEEAAELTTAAAPPTLADQRLLHQVVARLEALAVSGAAGSAAPDGPRLLALRDPVDGSVQPVRLSLPAAAAGPVSAAEPPPLVLLLRAGPLATAKVRWPPLPAAWQAAAAAAGVAVCDVYPAGDLDFTGAARRRMPLAEALARAACQQGPVALAPGPAIVIAAHDGLADPVAWRQPRPPPAPAVRRGRLAAWAEGPFVVVVGTGEHAAARADARRLAQQFGAAWAAHAHGLAPVVDDAAYRPADWPGRNLVLVGSPRGNRLLAELVATWPERRIGAFPLVWDDRDVRCAGHAFHRSLLPGIALAVPDPRDPRLTVLVLDGSPAWSGWPMGADPLAGAPLPFAAEAVDADVVLRGASPDGETVRLLLESPTRGP